MLVPKLVTTLRQGYTRRQAVSDLTAGVIVGIVALPLSIAFAIASGVTPDRGLWTAVVAGFVISALGGSRVQIGGPTGAFVVIVYGIVQQHGLDGLAIATLMAGVILVILGFAGLGSMIKFIPHPVVTGFTSGIAVIIFTGQLRDLLGLRMPAPPANFTSQLAAYAASAETVSWPAAIIAGLTIGIIAFWPRIAPRIPGPFVALIATTLLAHAAGLNVETIGGRFGVIDTSFPSVSLPSGFDVERLPELLRPAVAIAMLAAIESLLSAVVADGMIGGRHRSNMELIAQGAANIAVPLFGGIPATGAIARTATNVKNGGRTPVAGIVHALTLLLITLFAGRYAALIPMATLAGILTVVAYQMSEWRTFRAELRAPRGDVAVLLVTFVLTIAVDLTLAIEVGVVLAVFVFMRRMSEVTNVSVLRSSLQDSPEDPYDTDVNAIRLRSIPPGVEVYEIEGPFFFGAAETFKDTLGRIGRRPKVLIIRMRNVPVMDSTGLHLLGDLVKRVRADGTLVLLADVHAQPMMAMARAGLLERIGEDQLFGNIDDALNRARAHLGLPTIPRPEFAQPTVIRETPAYGITPVDGS